MLYKKLPLAVFFTILGLSLACAAPALATTPTTQATRILPTTTTISIPTETPVPTAASSPTVIPSDTPVAVIASSATPVSFLQITFERNTNCRRGPAIYYFQTTSFLKDHSTTARGRNGDSSWLWVNSAVNPAAQCWVSVTNVKSAGTFDPLPLIEFPSLPQAPTQLFVVEKSCGARNIVTLQWSSISGETGFHFFRNGIMLSLLKTDAFQYTDYPPRAHEYIYEVESINNDGVSVRTAITVAGCKQ